MSSTYEITVPETKPATEWILGKPVRKVSPKRRHAQWQLVFGAALRAWAQNRGLVGTEWRFRVAPPGEPRRPLVPDIAYLAADRFKQLAPDDREEPPLAPDVAVEVWSKGDKREYLDHKIEVYLAAGSKLIVVVDPFQRLVIAYDRAGKRAFDETQVFTDEALPGFTLDLAAVFAEIDAFD